MYIVWNQACSTTEGSGACSINHSKKNIHTYIPTYIHTYVHTYIHTYIHTYYNPTQLSSLFACPNLRVSKCSKQRNGNIISNWTPLIFFVLFHDYQSLQIFSCMDGSLKNVCTASLGIMHTACHILGRKRTTRLSQVFKTRTVSNSPPPLLNILSVPDWQNFKYNCFLIGPKIKILNTL